VEVEIEEIENFTDEKNGAYVISCYCYVVRVRALGCEKNRYFLRNGTVTDMKSYGYPPCFSHSLCYNGIHAFLIVMLCERRRWRKGESEKEA